MDRRNFLVTTWSLYGAMTLAGCSDTASTIAGTPTPSAGEHLEAAGEALDKAGTELSRESEKFENAGFETGVNFDPSAINDYLDKAERELDEAEPLATESQQDRIDVGRDYIAFARKATELLDVLAEALSQTSSGYSYFQSDRWSDATEQFKTANSTYSKVEEHLAVLRDRHEQVDTSNLDDFDQIDFDSFLTDIDRLEDLVTLLKGMNVGLRQIALGLIDLEEGQKYMESDDMVKAEQSYANAVDHFADSEMSFKGLEETAPSDMKSTVIDLTCYAGALEEGTEHLRTAAEELRNGNSERANAEVDEASKDYDKCSFDE